MNVSPAMTLDNWSAIVSVHLALLTPSATVKHQTNHKSLKGELKGQWHPHQILQLHPLPWHSCYDPLNSDMDPPRQRNHLREAPSFHPHPILCLNKESLIILPPKGTFSNCKDHGVFLRFQPRREQMPLTYPLILLKRAPPPPHTHPGNTHWS